MFSCDWCEIFKITHLEKYLQTATPKNLSGAAVLIFRKYFRSSSLSSFYKKCICWSPVLVKLQTIKFYQIKDCITNIFQLILQNLYSDRKFSIQTFNSKQTCLSHSWHATLTTRNQDFVSMMHKTWKAWTSLDDFRTSNLQLSYYTNF